MADIHPDLVGRIKKFIAYLPGMLKEYDEVFTGNVIAQQRMKGIGILSKEDAISYGVTGPSGRASGWSCDVRKLHPYGVYDRVEFKEMHPHGLRHVRPLHGSHGRDPRVAAHSRAADR